MVKGMVYTVSTLMGFHPNPLGLLNLNLHNDRHPMTLAYMKHHRLSFPSLLPRVLKAKSEKKYLLKR